MMRVMLVCSIMAILAIGLCGCDSIVRSIVDNVIYDPPGINDVAFSPSTNRLTMAIDRNGAPKFDGVSVDGWYMLPGDPLKYGILFRDSYQRYTDSFDVIGYAWTNGNEWRERPDDTSYYFHIEATTSTDNEDNNTTFTTEDVWRYQNGIMVRVEHDTRQK